MLQSERSTWYGTNVHLGNAWKSIPVQMNECFITRSFHPPYYLPQLQLLWRIGRGRWWNQNQKEIVDKNVGNVGMFFE